MHLSRGHTNSNVISGLPFTESADLKSVTHLFLLHSALIIRFQGGNCRAYERQNVTLAGRCMRLLLGVDLLDVHGEG